MGYRSEVRFVVALPSEAERDSIMALYSMHPLVQEHNMATEWTPYEVMVWTTGDTLTYPKVSRVTTHVYPCTC
jgi:hypothetical protein